MGDRTVTLLGALGALLLLIALVYAPGSAAPVARPTSEEHGPPGYRGLANWLALEGVPTASLRRRVDAGTLREAGRERGNVLITTMPHQRALRAAEKEALATWVAAGNTLLVLAALNESPHWLLGTDAADFLEDLEDITGLAFVELEDAQGEVVNVGGWLEGADMSYRPQGPHPLMQGIERLAGRSDLATNLWRPRLTSSPEFVARLADASSHGAPSLWQIPRGRGQVIVSASSSLLSNAQLGKADNARFFANLLAWHLAPGAEVLFDDLHQGLSDLYDPQAFFSDPRLHNTLWFILGFWLLYLLGGSGRLAVQAPLRPVPEQADVVAAAGRFMARKLDTAQAGRAMIDTWLRDMRRAGLLSKDGGSGFPGAELARLPMIDRHHLEILHESYRRLGQGGKVNLATLHNTLLEIRKNLA